ncbi:MAG: hypothetical protein QOJ42_2320 [Acidobacteriaceae bacterium]|nr:hypothetical protein [Acidobacteriaceae bacterium]
MTAQLKRSGILGTLLLMSSVLFAGIVAVACGGSGSTTTTTASTTSTANVMLSDPATCAGPSGPFTHVYVTITDVQANISSNAGDSDSGWTDLTPSLSSQPKQIDLLGQANNQCFLATLGDTQQLQAGKYQQIRLILADNSATVANNLCGNSTNCVVLAADSSVHELLLSSESKTGLKIPSGQIASGGFTIAAGETKDLDIDFNTCASIVIEGNGQYRLKPVLHAGEVSTTSTSINGKVLDQATGNPVNGVVTVALEQKDASGVDRIVMSTLAGSDGSFIFCPIPTGTYDIVIVGEAANGTAYQPSIVAGVANGQTVGSVDLYSGLGTAASVVQIAGGVTSQNGASQGTVADIAVSALEPGQSGGTTYTIPLLPNAQQPAATLALETTSSSSCSAGTDCATYTMLLPAGGPYVGAYSASGTTLSQSAPLATYIVDGLAFVPSSGGTADCTPSEQKTVSYQLATGGSNIIVQPLAFTQCQ